MVQAEKAPMVQAEKAPIGALDKRGKEFYNITSIFSEEVQFMNKFIRTLSGAALSALMLTGTAAVPAMAAESSYEEIAAQTIQVTEAEISQRGFANAVQSALDTAENLAADNSPVTVKVAAGSYDLSRCLFIFSNTTLDMTGVTVTRQFRGNMLRTGQNDSPNSGVTGYFYRNITLRGGTL